MLGELDLNISHSEPLHLTLQACVMLVHIALTVSICLRLALNFLRHLSLRTIQIFVCTVCSQDLFSYNSAIRSQLWHDGVRCTVIQIYYVVNTLHVTYRLSNYVH